MASRGALPLTPVGTSAPADMGQFAAAAAAADNSPRITQPTIPEHPQASAAAPAAEQQQQQAGQPQKKKQQQQAQPAQQKQPASASAAADGAAQRGGPPEQGEQKRPLKEMSKAERRALQEAQRAAKAAAKGGPAASGGGGGGGAAPAADSKPLQKQGSGTNLARQGAPVSRQSSFAKQEAEGKGAAAAAAGGEQQQGKGGRKAGAASEAAAAAGAGAAPAAARAKSAEMFAHLPQPRHVTLQSVAEQKGPPGGLAGVPGVGAGHPEAVWHGLSAAACNLPEPCHTLGSCSLSCCLVPYPAPSATLTTPHGAVPLAAVKLGLRYADGSVRGGNARCIAMLQMFMQCIQASNRTAAAQAADSLAGSAACCCQTGCLQAPPVSLPCPFPSCLCPMHPVTFPSTPPAPPRRTSAPPLAASLQRSSPQPSTTSSTSWWVAVWGGWVAGGVARRVAGCECW
jgi:hypothetical protein